MTVPPEKLQKFYSPFRDYEVVKVNPALHYKSPLVSRRLNINHVKYDERYYKPDEHLTDLVNTLKPQSLLYNDFLQRKQRE